MACIFCLSTNYRRLHSKLHAHLHCPAYANEAPSSNQPSRAHHGHACEVAKKKTASSFGSIGHLPLSATLTGANQQANGRILSKSRGDVCNSTPMFHGGSCTSPPGFAAVLLNPPSIIGLHTSVTQAMPLDT